MLWLRRRCCGFSMRGWTLTSCMKMGIGKFWGLYDAGLASSRVEGCFWEGLALCVCVSVLCVCAGVGGSFILGSAPPHALFDFFYVSL